MPTQRISSQSANIITGISDIVILDCNRSISTLNKLSSLNPSTAVPSIPISMNLTLAVAIIFSLKVTQDECWRFADIGLASSPRHAVSRYMSLTFW
jgi:hypothetical protein